MLHSKHGVLIGYVRVKVEGTQQTKCRDRLRSC